MQAELVVAKRHSSADSERQQKVVADLDMRTKELKQAQSNYNKSVRHAHPRLLCYVLCDSCTLLMSACACIVYASSIVSAGAFTFMPVARAEPHDPVAVGCVHFM